MDVLSYILAKNYTDVVTKDIIGLHYLVVDELPDIGEPGVIYLVRVAADVYTEYVWQNGEFVKLKDTVIANIITEGYYFANVFWKESAHINRLPDYIQSIYIDMPTREFYCYDSGTQSYKKFLQQATPTVPGFMKLYDDSGNNVDGTMTQKSITTKLKKKVEIDTSKLASDECLGLEINKA